MLEVAATWSRNISSLNWHFLSHSPSRRQGELIYFSCLFPYFLHRSLSIFFMVAFVLQQFVQFVLFVVFHFCCFCWLCLFSLLVSLLLICHSFLSLDFCLLVFSSCFFSSFLRSMFFLPVVCLILLLFLFLLLCFFLWLTPILFLCFSLSFVFISYLIGFFFALCFLLLVPPLSHLLCFLLPRPPRALEKDNHGKNNYLILFAFQGSLRKCPLRKIIVYFSFVAFFCPQNMFLLDILGICFSGSKGLFVASYLLLYRCFGVWWRAFFLSNLSLVPACLGFVLFCVRSFLFWVLLFLWSFAEVCFLLFYLPHLGLLFLRCCVVVLVFQLHVLAVCFCVWVLVFSFCG